ncbi:MAG: GNAT family N-acetyltransferase [Hyphomicrobiales bacterium]|nr:GNAT family N-acetyltransferase [Hyphomicrobiales bacterium]
MTDFANAKQFSFAVYDSFDAARVDWRSVAERSDPAPFQTPFWAETWWNTVGKARHDSYRIVVVSEFGEPQAVFPFVLGRHHTVRFLEWMADDQADWRGPLVSWELLSRLRLGEGVTLVDAAVDALGEPVDAVLMREMPLTLSGRTSPFVSSEAVPSGDGRYVLPLAPATFDPTMPSGLGRSERRAFRRLNDVAPLRLMSAETDDERARLFSALKTMKSDWMDRNGIGNEFKDRDLSSFLRTLAMTEPSRETDRVGGHLAALLVGEEIVAVTLNIVQGPLTVGSVFAVTERPEFRRWSPGAIHLARLIDWYRANGYASFDFGAGMSTYKHRPGVIAIPHCSIFSQRSTLGYLLCSGERTLAAVKTRIKDNDWLFDQFKKLRAQVRGRRPDAA